MPLVLLVEDDLATRTALAAVLAEEGYAVCEAGDRDTGLDALRTRNPRLVILDYGLPMPDDGAEFLRIKAADPGIASIPVIVASGFVMPRVIEGVAAVMGKPFDLDAILALLHRFAGPPAKPNRTAA